MANSSNVSCGGCGRQYKWKPEIAGKKIRCKCGQVLQASATPPTSPAPGTEEPPDLYNLADDIVASVQQSAAVAPPIAMAPASGGAARPAVTARAAIAPANAVPSPMLGYQSRPTQRQIERGSPMGLEGDLGKDLILPIAMILAGTILNFVTLCGIGHASFGDAALWIGVSSVLSTLLIAVGCFAAMKLLDFSLGSPLQALLKVAAIAIAPDAVGDLITALVPFGGMLATFLTLGIYFALLMVFFDLDGTEVMITTCIFWVIQTWVVMIIVMGILSNSPIGDSIRASGGGALIAAGGGGMTIVGDEPDRELTEAEKRQAVDEAAIDVISGAEEGKIWLRDNPTATFHTVTRADTQQLVSQLYGVGCKQVAPGGFHYKWDESLPKEAHEVAITLPLEPAQREQAMQIITRFVQRYQATTTRSDGEKFVILEFSRDPLSDDEDDWDE